MESLERSRAVIDLGKRLVTQLKLGDDETAQWMAHALAERIQNAENAPPEDRVAAQNSCTELIFQLWERRHSLPYQLRPLKKLEPLLRTLDSLDVNNGPKFRFVQKLPTDMKVEEDVKMLLDAAVTVDDAARILVHYFLATAAEQSTEETAPWIQSAADAGADVTLEVRLLSFVDEGIDRPSDKLKVTRDTIVNKIEKLELFMSFAASNIESLKKKHSLLLNGIDDGNPDGD
jgi:hypothetical protein